MPTQSVPMGPPTTLVQNQVYALPGVQCYITSSAACEVSVDGTTWVAFTSGNFTSATFIRSAGVNTMVSCK